MALLFLLAFGSSLIFTAFKGWPIPSVHDEFSYLLSADTFLEGRLANPEHPVADHFETFHVLQHPSYASKYPPLQGLVLALGALLGHPALGIFLVSAAAVSAAYWALRPLFPHGWVLFGAVLAWAQLAPYTFYSFSYMGGNLGALASFLLFGAAVRIVTAERPSPRNGVLLGLAVVALAASRPFEGLLLCAGIGILLAISFIRAQPEARRAWLGAVLVPGGAVLLAGTALLLCYNHAVTRNAFQLPYAAYESTHSNTPLFLGGEMRNNPLPAEPRLRQFEKEFTEQGYLKEKARGFGPRFIERLEILRANFIPFWFPATILIFLSLWRPGRWAWFSWALILGFMAASSFTVWFSRYYAGGLLPFLCLLSCLGARSLFLFTWRGAPWGFQLFRLAVWSLFLLQLLLTVGAPSAALRVERVAAQRAEVEARLLASPGDDLVFVTYRPGASVHEEWVYNRADIDAAPVVWARSLGPDADAALVQYFSGRRIWRIEIGGKEAGPLTEVVR